MVTIYDSTRRILQRIEGDSLIGAHLEGANLRAAHLWWADLEGADLEGADLRAANLRAANLRAADLRGANLRAADLRGANLLEANLEGALERFGIPDNPSLPAQILAQITAHPETWDQRHWHAACGMKHCIAGWACVLSGPLGHYLDVNLGTETAATLLLWQPGCQLPSFMPGATEEETLGRLRTMVAHLRTLAQKDIV